MFKLTVTILLFLFLNPAIYAQVLTVTGNWSLSISASSLTEAGNDFTGTYTSASTQTYIDVDVKKKNDNWRIDVRKSDINWNPALILSVRRTGNGNSSGPAPNGGTTFIQLTNSNQEFFRGRKDNPDIPVEYRLSGISVTIPAQSYSTTVIYTLTIL
jgi:hypothetical protein